MCSCLHGGGEGGTRPLKLDLSSFVRVLWPLELIVWRRIPKRALEIEVGVISEYKLAIYMR